MPAEANVAYVDDFKPTMYGFNRAPGFYAGLKLKPSDYALGKFRATGLSKQVPKKKKAPAKKKAEVKKPKTPKLSPAPNPYKQRGETPVFPKPSKAKEGAQPVQLPLSLKKGEHVVFLGNALAERMDYHGFFETALHANHGGKQVVFRNIATTGDTPGFRAHPSRKDPWAFPGAHKFYPHLKTHRGEGHYPSQDEWLYELKADTIVAFFGYNESFDGEARLETYKQELAAFIKHTQSLAYNGKTAPRLVLVSPIAFEDRSADYDLPSGQEENARLVMYRDAMAEVAAQHKVGWLDIFEASQSWYQSEEVPMTVNGCHLSEAGYQKLAPFLVEKLFGNGKEMEGSANADAALLHQAVKDKAWLWQNDYHMPNGVHVYGRRWQPYGDKNYPEEIEKIRQMTKLRDELIWSVAQGKVKSLEVDDSKTRALTAIETNYKIPVNYQEPAEALKKFNLPEGFEIELFASEKEFPLLQNPVQMSFDDKGRLWVAVMPSYPHYKPGGERPDDKLLILEDTDGDFKADKQTIFADGLHLPIGFELAPEGVYLSQEPNLLLLEDTDGDDKADKQTLLLSGFDTHDTHHAIGAFSTDASGAIYLCEGIFLHSQVETPYGPVRGVDAAVYRFDPRSWRLERYSQVNYPNPWGICFDDWGQPFLTDGSGGRNYWLTPLSVKMPHGKQIGIEGEFTPDRVRPTSGVEFVSSRHFPEEMQGDYLVNNCIGFLGTKQHRMMDDGAGFTAELRQDLIQSDDGNFRPVDLEFAPDGSLYVVDWHNALIGHMQHSARDPKRISTYGRVYRLKHGSRPLVEAPKVEGASVDELLENLKLHEYRARYRSRRALRGHDRTEVLEKTKAWVAKLDAGDAAYWRHVLEGLWVGWAMGEVDEALLQKCLAAKNENVRAAALRVVKHAYAGDAKAAAWLLAGSADESARVRVESYVAASWLEDEQAAAKIGVEAMKKPVTKWMSHAMQATMTTLKPTAQSLVDQKLISLEGNDAGAKFLAGKLKFEPKKGYDKKRMAIINVPKKARKLYDLGHEVYHREGHCGTCHQARGQGIPNIYPPLTKNRWVAGDPERLIKLVLKGLWGPIEVNGVLYDPSKGVPPMTGFAGLLNDEEVAAVLTYVRYNFKNSYPMITPEMVAKVRAETKDRLNFYMVEELLKEHPFQD